MPALGVTGIVFNNVTWSLFYEMVFYLSLPLVVMLSRRFAVPVVGAIVSAGIVFAYGPGLIGFYSEFFLFLFAGSIIGALSPAGVKIVADSFPDAIVAVLYCAVGWLMAAGYLTTAQFVWLFAGLGVIIVCKAIGGEGTLARCLAWTPLVRLGRISYSFYLLHSVALAALFTFWWRLWLPLLGTIGNAVYLGAIGFAVAVGLAWLSFMLAERFYFIRREPVAMATADNQAATRRLAVWLAESARYWALDQVPPGIPPNFEVSRACSWAPQDCCNSTSGVKWAAISGSGQPDVRPSDAVEGVEDLIWGHVGLISAM